MVDDSSKRSGGEHGDAVPVGNALPVSRPSSMAPRSSDSILTAFRVKTDFSELRQIDSSWDESTSESIDDGWDDVATDDHSDVRNSGLELKPQLASAASMHAALGRALRVDEADPASAPTIPTSPNWGSGEAETADLTPGELTPSPMVVCEASSNSAESSSISIAENEDFVWRGSSLECGIGVWRSHSEDDEECTEELIQSAGGDVTAPGQVEYHAPRPPPSSATPPKLEASVCVATDFDPKAPTQPRIPRSSLPASPMLLGLDRMLIWGMLLGGLFVAIIVVIVNQVALTKLRPPAGDANSARQVQPSPPNQEPPGASVDPRQQLEVPAPGGTGHRTEPAEAAGQTEASPTRESSAPKSKKGRTNDKGHVPLAVPSAPNFTFDTPILGPDRSFQRLAEPKQ